MSTPTPPSLVVSVDTEEDDWGWASTAPYQCENARELPRLMRFFERLGVRPTFFVTHAYLSDPYARDVIGELSQEEWVEIGCHVHPWNTPPFDREIPRRTMLYEYPQDLQRAKIARLTELIEEVTGSRPTSFRAGRFGFGPLTSQALLAEGFEVDSSVTPHWDWRESSHGPSYLEAPLGVYRIKAGEDVLVARDDGELIEVPLTSGFNRLKPDHWLPATRMIEGSFARRIHLGGVAARLADLRRVILTPEAHDLDDMVSLGRRTLEGGIDHLQVFFHSSSLLAGCTPFTPTDAEVDHLYARFEAFLEEADATATVEPRTVTEAARRHAKPKVVPENGRSEAALHVRRELPGGLAGLRAYGGIRVAVDFMVHRALWRLGRYEEYQDVRWNEVRRLVFVCSGNICRSSYAEYWAQQRGLSAVSIGVRTFAGKPAASMAMKVAADRGVRLDEHRTTPVEDFEPEAGDLLVAMEPWQANDVLERTDWSASYQVTLLGLWIGGHGPVVLDPYGGSEACFHHSLALVEEGIAGIEGAWKARAPITPEFTESLDMSTGES